MSVDTILSFFRLVVSLLEKRERECTAKVEDVNASMSELIIQREALTTEAQKAAAAKKKIKELLV